MHKVAQPFPPLPLHSYIVTSGSTPLDQKSLGQLDTHDVVADPICYLQIPFEKIVARPLVENSSCITYLSGGLHEDPPSPKTILR